MILNGLHSYFYINIIVFSTLLPRVNSWLREHLCVDLVKCETVEKKLSSLELLSEQSPTYEQPRDHNHTKQTIYLKGLR